jgi:DNA-binding IclR family transcriptional regulator
VPIFDQTGSVIAAISIAGTTSQIDADNVDDLAQRAKNTADLISRTLGHRPERE